MSDAALLLIADKWLPYILAVLGGLALAMVVFVIQLMRYGPEIKKLNQIETIAKLAYFADSQQQAVLTFGKAAAASDLVRKTANDFRTDLESLRSFVIELQARNSETNADAIAASRLGGVDEVEISARQTSERVERAPEGAVLRRAGDFDTDAMYREMMAEWDRFLAVLQERAEAAGVTPDLRKIGRLTYDLADRRRKAPLPVETAELITALHSQYKRYIRLQGTRHEWLTPELYGNFLQLLGTAIEELRRPPQQGELTL